MRIGAQIMDPSRIFRCPALRPHKNVAIALLDPHQRRFPDCARLMAPVSDDDDRQARVAQSGALGAAAALIQFDLLTHPGVRARNILGHDSYLQCGTAKLNTTVSFQTAAIAEISICNSGRASFETSTMTLLGPSLGKYFVRMSAIT